MKNLKILITSVTLIIISLVIIQSCTSNNDEVIESNLINLEIEKSKLMGHDSNFENLSNVTKKEYLAMSNKQKNDFRLAYIEAFRSGGSCSCSHSSGCECSVNCPSGTKPKCQCSEDGCDCGCEPYGSGGISIHYKIIKNKDGSVVLTEKQSWKESLNNLEISDLPNAKKIVTLFKDEPIFNKINNGVIKLSSNEYYLLESKFQALMENYTIEQYFEIEYGF